MAQEDPKLKLANLILEHPEVNVYFDDLLSFDDMANRTIVDVKFIKEGYVFGAFVYKTRFDFESDLEDSASWNGEMFNADLFKTKITDYLSKNHVDYYDDLDEDKAYKLISSLVDMVKPEDFILVITKPLFLE